NAATLQMGPGHQPHVPVLRRGRRYRHRPGRARQPGQRRRRPGGPEHELDARFTRTGGPRVSADAAMTTTASQPYTVISDGSSTSARGFKAGALAAGIKASGRPDLGIWAADAPCVAAAT